MTRPLAARASAAALVMALAAMGSISGAEQRGGGGGGNDDKRPSSAATFPLAGWTDLETWSRDAANGNDTEIGVGLQFTGPKGKVGAAFEVTRLRNAPKAPVKEVVMTIIPQYDPTRVRFRDAWFVVTTVDPKGGGKKDQKLDFSSKLVAYPPGPYAAGDAPVSARVQLKPEEFSALAAGDSVTGNLVNVGFDIRPDQIKALRAFAQRVGLLVRR